MGKRIVINTYGSAGDLNPFLAVARALLARGHHIVVASEGISRAAIESAGLEFHYVRRGFSYGHENPNDMLFHNIHNSYDDLLVAVGQADLLITHHLAIAGPIVAASTGLPWVSVALYPLTFASEHHPVISGASPDSGQFTTSIYQTYLNNMNGMKQASYILTKQAQRLREQLGLPQGNNVLFQDHHSPHLVLALFSSAFAAPQAHWPPQTRVTGFPFDNGLTVDAGLPTGLERFLNEGTPPIVFTLGSLSVFDTGGFLATSVNGAQMLGHRALLVGSSISAKIFTNHPDVMNVDYVPYHHLLPRAAAIVHHGGIGTIAAAMRAGCPMLVLPGDGSFDLCENAAYVKERGVARILGLAEYMPFSAAAELAQLLHDPSYAQKAADLSLIVQSEDGVGSACDEIEKYLKRTG